MEAPKSLKQKEGEPTMSYINKGMKILFARVYYYHMHVCLWINDYTSAHPISCTVPKFHQVR